MNERFLNKKEETISRAEIETLQLEKLKQVVSYVYENNNVYRTKMDNAKIKPQDLKSLADIEKLPFTTKEDLRANYPFGMFTAKQEDIVRVHASSGTTGKLTVVGYTKNDIDVWSKLMARCLVMSGADKNSICNIAYGYGLFTGGLGGHYGAEYLGAMAIPSSAGNTSRQLDLMSDFKATHLLCTPSYAVYLSEELRKRNQKIASLKAGIFGAEPWTEEMRQQIEKELDIDAYDIYGLSEIMGPGVSMECEHKCGLHIMEDHFLAEIIDPETLKPALDGQDGELVFTTLTKEGIPLIRYRTRDLTSITKEKCKCGRCFSRMKKVHGRTDDMLIIRGVNVFPSQVETALLQFADVIEPLYQIVVSRLGLLDEMEIHIEAKNDFKDEIEMKKLEKTIDRAVSSAIGIDANIKILGRNSIPRSEGKAKRVIDNRKF